MNTPIDLQTVSNPPYYVEGRSIQPIDVIEGWSFCHHLGCVVKYIARLGRKNAQSRYSILEDLRKAEWYLMREIADHPCTCMPHPQPIPTSWEAIAEDWELPPSLGQAIFYLTCHQRLFYSFPGAKVICLRHALTHLRAEIKSASRVRYRNRTVPALRRDSQTSWGQTPPALTNIIIFKGGKPCVNPQE